MHPLRRLSVAEQTAAHLRQGLRRGRWRGQLPGVARLAGDLDVARATVLLALRQLEHEGLLKASGRGRSRIVTARGAAQRRLRVGILLHDTLPRGQRVPKDENLLQIQHDLETAGHEVFFTTKSQVDLRHDVTRITRLIEESPADAWIACSSSRPVLEWFAGQPVPCLALYGTAGGLLLATTAPDKGPAYAEATRRLIALGHRRIVLLTLSPRRKPEPGKAERAFLDELAAHGITPGKYHLPDWEETPEGFSALLENLFRVTPPTALIIQETPRVIAALQFLAQRGLRVPGQVSVVATDYDQSLAWCHPPIAHMRWDSGLIVRRVVRWAAAVRKGRADHEAIYYPAEFVPGGTIGPAAAGERVIVPSPRAEASGLQPLPRS